MSEDVYPYLRPQKNPLLKRALLKTVALYFLFALLIVAVGVLSATVLEYRREANGHEAHVSRSLEEYINGGKRFLDYFLSMNSATVDFDHYRAITMIVNEDAKQARQRYLLETDFFRRVKEARMLSKIDWRRSTVNVIESGDEGAKIEYVVLLVLERKTEKTSNIVLDLVAQPTSDDYPDGVGVASWVDVAAQPFKEEKQ